MGIYLYYAVRRGRSREKILCEIMTQSEHSMGEKTVNGGQSREQWLLSSRYVFTNSPIRHLLLGAHALLLFSALLPVFSEKF
jgi:hypothetical protein